MMRSSVVWRRMVAVGCALVLVCSEHLLAGAAIAIGNDQATPEQTISDLGQGARVRLTVWTGNAAGGVTRDIEGLVQEIHEGGLSLAAGPGSVSKIAFSQVRSVQVLPVDRLTWTTFAGQVRGRRVSLNSPSGVVIEGRVVGVEPDALVINVETSADLDRQPKGRMTVPRQALSVVWVRDTTGSRALGNVLGVLVALGGVAIAAVASIAVNEGDESAKVMQVAGVPVGIGLGALVGWSVGRKGGQWLPMVVTSDPIP